MAAPTPLAQALLLVCLLCRWATAQEGITDPRQAEDPRATADPRAAKDPREREQQPAPGEEPPLHAQLDELHAQRNLTELTRVIADHPWEIEAYLNDLCKRCVEQAKQGSARSEADRLATDALHDKALEIARLADDGLIDTRFGYQVHTMLSWTAAQRLQWTEATQLTQAAVDIMDAAAAPQDWLPALTPLRQAQTRSRELGDIIGQCNTLVRIGRIQWQNGHTAEARDTMREALEAGRSIRHLDTVWDALDVIRIASIRQQDFDTALQALRDQHQVAVEMKDDAIARAVLDQLVQLDGYVRVEGL